MNRFKNKSISLGAVAYRAIICLAAAFIITYFYPHPESSHFNYEEGRPWNYATLFAPFDIPVHADSAHCKAVREALDSSFVPVYRIDVAVVDSIIDRLPKTDSKLRNQLAAHLRRIYAQGVVDSDTRRQIAKKELPKIRVAEKNVLSEKSTISFTSPIDIYEQLDTVLHHALREYFHSANLQEILTPNVIYDEVESRRLYEHDYQIGTADRGVIQVGQTIINKGAVITPQDYTNLRTYEALLEESISKEGKSDWWMLLGQFFYVSLVLAALFLYLWYYNPELFGNLRSYVFVITLITVFFLLSLAANSFVSFGIYLSPLAIVPVLMLVFFDGRTAFMTAIVESMICAAITTFPLEFIFLQFCAAGAAIYSLRQLSRRSQLLFTAAFVAGAYLLSYLTIELLMNGTFAGLTLRMVLYLIINAIFTSMAYVLMWGVERVFGFISPVTLVELADTNNPILRRLNDECPGTFQHSLSVGNLAADAAKRIGANEQLVRAGAMYHDIGKLSNPAFFTENQHGVNPHDSLTPEQSARIIVGHVIEGLRMADRAGLPQVIRNFISEHHGKGTAKYFYYNYCNQHPGENVDPTPFSYPGPNPRSKETAVLMMADAVEAASRSLKEYTQDSIKELVNKIIDGQIAAGMFDESPLSFSDVPIIKETFIKRLKTMYHTRIEYPEAPKNVTSE